MKNRENRENESVEPKESLIFRFTRLQSPIRVHLQGNIVSVESVESK